MQDSGIMEIKISLHHILADWGQWPLVTLSVLNPGIKRAHTILAGDGKLKASLQRPSQISAHREPWTEGEGAGQAPLSLLKFSHLANRPFPPAWDEARGQKSDPKISLHMETGGQKTDAQAPQQQSA